MKPITPLLLGVCLLVHAEDTLLKRAGEALQQKNFPVALSLAQQAIQQNPRDPATHYILGVVYWADAYGQVVAAKREAGVPMTQQFTDESRRAALRQRIAPLLQEGHRAIDEAIALEVDTTQPGPTRTCSTGWTRRSL